MASPVSGDLLARSRANSSADDDLENDQAGVLQELQFLHKYNKVIVFLETSLMFLFPLYTVIFHLIKQPTSHSYTGLQLSLDPL